ncbi:MAG: hypothetical protein QXE77_06180 [Desulfurococcaceae archaeon]
MVLSIIHVVYDQVEALTLVDRITVVNIGEIVQIDVPKKMYENPKHVL